MRSGERSTRGALWAIAHSVAAAADALEAGKWLNGSIVAGKAWSRVLTQTEIEAEIREAGYADRYLDEGSLSITVPFAGVIDIRPADPMQQWSTGVLVEEGTYRLTRLIDERPEGETS
jgi:hypothetical protein